VHADEGASVSIEVDTPLQLVDQSRSSQANST